MIFVKSAFQSILNKLTGSPTNPVYISSIILFLSGFIIWGIYKINLPSFYYDELMFANVALGCIDDSFIWNKFLGIPTMIFPYIGALKSYFYWIAFYFFDPSYYSIRVPALLLMALSIFLLSRIIAHLSNKTTALIVLIILCVNPSLAMFGKFDVGPTVFEFFVRCALILCLALITLKKHPQRALVALIFLSILGMFNKLSFIWFLNSILPIFILLQLLLNNQKSFKAWFSKNRKTLLVILGTWLLAIIWFILIYKLNNLNPTVNSDPAMPWKSIPSKLIGISHVIQNVGIYNNFLRHPVPGPSIPFLYFNFITFFSGFIYYSAYLIKSRRSNRPVNPSHFMAILLFCSSCLILTQIIITPAAIHAWHFFCLYPSLLLFAILSWIHILHAIKEHIIFHKSLSSLLIGGMILYGIFINTIVHKKIKNVAPQTKNWERIFSTTTNDAFLAYLKDHPQIYFHFLDWGMHTLAITLLAETRFHETFNFPNELSGVSINTGDYFVTHSPEASAFPKIRSVFFNYLNQFGLDYTLDHKIVDTDGLTVFEFWKINKSAAVGTPIFNLHDSPLDLFQGHACTINASLHKKTLEINTHDIDPVVLLPKFHFPSSAHDYIVQVEIHSSTTTLFRLFPQTVQQPHYGFNLSTRIIPGNNHLFFLLPNHELIGRLRMDPGEKPGRYVFKSISVSRIKPK